MSFCCIFSNCDDAMKDSLGVALRHSRNRCKVPTVYDHKTTNQKNGNKVEMEQEDDDGEQNSRSDDQSDVSVGDFVGLVIEDFTLNDPCVLVGCMQELLPGSQVSLQWYKHKGGGLYLLEVEGGWWIEDLSALVPMTVKPARGKVDCYRLATILRTIHKAVFNSRSS